jgi:hypothetical protein
MDNSHHYLSLFLAKQAEETTRGTNAQNERRDAVLAPNVMNIAAGVVPNSVSKARPKGSSFPFLNNSNSNTSTPTSTGRR